MTADKKQYSPRDPVKLHIKTDRRRAASRSRRTSASRSSTTRCCRSPTTRAARILAKLYLEPELGATDADPIEEPNFYFGDKPEATRGDGCAARDARLSQVRVAAGVQPAAARRQRRRLRGGGLGRRRDRMAAEGAMPMPEAPRVAEAPEGRCRIARSAGGEARGSPSAQHAGARPAQVAAANASVMRDLKEQATSKTADAKHIGRGGRIAGRRGCAAIRGVGRRRDGIVAGWSPVRVFPVPQYTKGYEGPRTDFRETIYWNASVDTGSRRHRDGDVPGLRRGDVVPRDRGRRVGRRLARQRRGRDPIEDAAVARCASARRSDERRQDQAAGDAHERDRRRDRRRPHRQLSASAFKLDEQPRRARST